MSDFFRIPVNPDLCSLGMTSLALKAHEAEDTDNDILLMQVAHEVESREPLAQDVFRAEYIRLHDRRKRVSGT